MAKETPVRRWPVVGRAFLRARMSPTLAALLSFAVVLMALGTATYVAAVPGLAAESPLVRELFGRSAVAYGPEAPLAATGGERAIAGEVGEDGSFAANPNAAAGLIGDGADVSPGEAPGTAGSPQSSLSMGAAAAGPSSPRTSDSDGGTGAYPKRSASAEPDASGASEPKGESNASGNGASGAGKNEPPSSDAGTPSNPNDASDSSTDSSGSNSGSSSGNEPGNTGSETALPPSEGGPVPADMELRIRDALRSEYDILDKYAKRVYACADDYERLCMTDPKEPRQAAARAVDALLRECQVSDAHVSETVRIACGMSQEYGGIWATSRYIDSYTALQHCYGALENYLYQLSYAWSGNCYFDVPSEHVDYWGTRIAVNKKTGRPQYLEDYESERKGARP